MNYIKAPPILTVERLWSDAETLFDMTVGLLQSINIDSGSPLQMNCVLIVKLSLDKHSEFIDQQWYVTTSRVSVGSGSWLDRSGSLSGFITKLNRPDVLLSCPKSLKCRQPFIRWLSVFGKPVWKQSLCWLDKAFYYFYSSTKLPQDSVLELSSSVQSSIGDCCSFL